MLISVPNHWIVDLIESYDDRSSELWKIKLKLFPHLRQFSYKKLQNQIWKLLSRPEYDATLKFSDILISLWYSSDDFLVYILKFFWFYISEIQPKEQF